MLKYWLKRLRILSFWILIGILIGASTMFIKFADHSKNDEKSIKYQKIEEIDRILNQEYYDQEQLLSGREKMMSEAVKGYVNGLWDPYTSFLDSEEFSGLQQELEGEWHIEGIGAVVGKKEYYIQIEELVKWSPAFQAWLQPLDRILMIGSWETKDLTTSQAVTKIRGPKWSSVTLFIERPVENWSYTYFHQEVVRDVIDIPSVKGEILNQSWVKLWYLEISIFGDQTNKLVNRAITDLINEKVQGLILDLRGNGGGILQSAVDIAGHFLDPQTPVVNTKYRNYEDALYESKGYWELKNYPLVILINGLSASASEILALSLKENLNATIVGTKSFGKGSIQTLQELKDKTSIKYTVGKWFWPKGTSIDKEGIIPDRDIPFDMTGYLNNKVDNQLEKAKEELLEKIN